MNACERMNTNVIAQLNIAVAGDMSVTMLAEKTAIKKERLWKILDGIEEDITLFELSRLSDALNIPISTMLFGKAEARDEGIYSLQKELKKSYQSIRTKNSLVKLEKNLTAFLDSECSRRIHELEGCKARKRAKSDIVSDCIRRSVDTAVLKPGMSFEKVSRSLGMTRKRLESSMDTGNLTIEQILMLSENIEVPVEKLLFGELSEKDAEEGMYYAFQKDLRSSFSKGVNKKGLLSLKRLLTYFFDTAYDKRLNEIEGLKTKDICIGEVLPSDAEFISEEVHK